MPRTPDRYEKKVRRAARKDEWGMLVMDANEVIDLLREEHAWVRRMVKKRQRYVLEDGVMIPYEKGNWVMVNLIEDQLTQRRK